MSDSGAVDLPLLHGFGDVGDLPVTLPMLLAGSGAAVMGSAALLGARAAGTLRSRTPTSAHSGARLPAGLTALADRPVVRGLLRAGAAVLLGLAGVTAALGADDFLANSAPALFFAVFWVGGLLVASVLLGPVWQVANPLRALSAGLARLAGDPDDRSVRPLPEGLGVWPGAAMLAVVVWAELVATRRPITVLLLLAAYALTQVGAAAVYGRAWYRHGDGFEVYSTTMGWLAPVSRHPDDGSLVLRSPRRRLAVVEAPAGLLAVVAVLLGGHLFDSLTDTLAWQQLLFGRPRVALQTAGLAACVGAVAALCAAVTRARFLRPALVPLVVAYAVAHYFGPVLVELQHAAITLSDPFGRGADLLGLTGRSVTYEAVPAALAAVGQLAAFVGFHVLAVVMAHDRAIARYDARAARAVQFPLRVLLVASVVGGVALRFGGPG